MISARTQQGTVTDPTGLGLAFFLSLCLLLSSSFTTVRGQEPNHLEVEDKYLNLLAKRPEPGVVFDRFIESRIQNESKEALVAFLQEKADRGSAVFTALLGHWQMRSRNYSAAAALFEKLTPEQVPGIHYWTAQAFQKNRQLDQALLFLNHALKDPGLSKQRRDEISIWQGQWLLQAGRREEALKTWNALLEAPNSPVELFQDVLQLQLTEGLFSEAESTAEKLIQRSQDDPYLQTTTLLELAEAQLRGNKEAAAMESYERALGASGNNSWIETEVLSRVSLYYRQSDNLTKLRDLFIKWMDAHGHRTQLHRALAYILADLGDTDKAETVFRKVIELSPGNRELRENFARFLEQVGQPEAAIKVIRQLISDSPEEARLQLQLASLWNQQKDSERRKAAISEYLRLSEETDLSAYSTAARFLENFGELAEAEKVLTKAAELKPERVDALELLTSFLQRHNRTPEAVDLCEKWSERITAIEGLRIVRILRRLGEVDRTWALIQQRRSDWANEPSFLQLYCQLALETNRADQALPEAERLVLQAESVSTFAGTARLVIPILKKSKQRNALIDRAKSIPKPVIPQRAWLALLYESEGDIESAMATLSKDVSPVDETLAIEVRINILERNQRWHEARAILIEALNLPQARARGENFRRVTDYSEKFGQLTEALRWTEEWKKASPQNFSPWLRQARLLRESGEIEQSSQILRKAYLLFPDEELVASRLADNYIRLGKANEAEELYLHLYERTESTSNKLKWATQYSKTATSLGRRQEVIDLFEERHRQSPRSEVPLLALVEFYGQQGDLQIAKKWLQKALHLRPENVDLLLQMSQLEEELGELASAREYIERARRFDKSSRSTNALARLLMDQGDEITGLRLLMEAASVNMQDSSQIEHVLLSLFERRKWNQILQLVDPILTQRPQDYRLRYLKARTLEEADRLPEALEEFLALIEKSLQEPPLDPTSINLQTWIDPLPPGYSDFAEYEALERIAYQSTKQSFPTPIRPGLSLPVFPNHQDFLPRSLREARPLSFAHVLHIRMEIDEPSKLLLRRRVLSSLPHFDAYLSDETRTTTHTSLLFSLPNSLRDNPAALFELATRSSFIDDSDFARHSVNILLDKYPHCAFYCLLCLPRDLPHEDTEFFVEKLKQLLPRIRDSKDLALAAANRIASQFYQADHGSLPSKYPDIEKMWMDLAEHWLQKAPSHSPYRSEIAAIQIRSLEKQENWGSIIKLVENELQKFRSFGKNTDPPPFVVQGENNTLEFPPRDLPNYPNWLLPGSHDSTQTYGSVQSLRLSLYRKSTPPGMHAIESQIPARNISALTSDRILQAMILTSDGQEEEAEALFAEMEGDPEASADELFLIACYKSTTSESRFLIELLQRAEKKTNNIKWRKTYAYARLQIGIQKNDLAAIKAAVDTLLLYHLTSEEARRIFALVKDQKLIPQIQRLSKLIPKPPISRKINWITNALPEKEPEPSKLERLIKSGNRDFAVRYAYNQLRMRFENFPGSPSTDKLIKDILSFKLTSEILETPLHPNVSAQEWFIRARIAESLGELEKKRLFLRKSVEKSPDFRPAATLLARYYLTKSPPEYKNAAQLIASSEKNVKQLLTSVSEISDPDPFSMDPKPPFEWLKLEVEILRSIDPNDPSTKVRYGQLKGDSWLSSIRNDRLNLWEAEPSLQKRNQVFEVTKEMARIPFLRIKRFSALRELSFTSSSRDQANPELLIAAENALLQYLTDPDSFLPPEWIHLSPETIWIFERLKRGDSLSDIQNQFEKILAHSEKLPNRAEFFRRRAALWFLDENDLVDLVLDDLEVNLPIACFVARQKAFEFFIPYNEITKQFEKRIDDFYPDWLTNYVLFLSSSENGFQKVRELFAFLDAEVQRLHEAYAPKIEIEKEYLSWVADLTPPSVFPTLISLPAGQKAVNQAYFVPITYEDSFLNPRLVRELIEKSELFFNLSVAGCNVLDPGGKSLPLLIHTCAVLRNSPDEVRQAAQETLQRQEKSLLRDFGLLLISQRKTLKRDIAAFNLAENYLPDLASLTEDNQKHLSFLFLHSLSSRRPFQISEERWSRLLEKVNYLDPSIQPKPQWLTEMENAKSFSDVPMGAKLFSELENGIVELIERDPTAAAGTFAKSWVLFQEALQTADPGILIASTPHEYLERFRRKILRDRKSPQLLKFCILGIQDPLLEKSFTFHKYEIWRFDDVITDAMKEDPSISKPKQFQNAYTEFENLFGDNVPSALVSSFFHTVYHEFGWSDWPFVEQWLKDREANANQQWKAELARSVRMGFLHHHLTHQWDRGELADRRDMSESFSWFLEELQKKDQHSLRSRLLLAREACLDEHEHIVPAEIVYTSAELVREAIDKDYVLDSTLFVELARHLARVEKNEKWNVYARMLVDYWFELSNKSSRGSHSSFFSFGNEACIAMLELLLQLGDETQLNRFLLASSEFLIEEPAAPYLMMRNGKARIAGDFIARNWRRIGRDYRFVYHDGTPFSPEELTAFKEGAGSPALALLGEVILESAPERRIPKPSLRGPLAYAEPRKIDRILPLIPRISNIEYNNPEIRLKTIHRIAHSPSYQATPELHELLNEELAAFPAKPIDLINKDDLRTARHQMTLAYAQIGAAARKGDLKPFAHYLDLINSANQNVCRLWLHWECFEYFSQALLHSWHKDPERIARDLIPILEDYLKADRIENSATNSYSLACLMTARLLDDSFDQFDVFWKELPDSKRKTVLKHATENRRALSGWWAALQRIEGTESSISEDRRIDLLSRFFHHEIISETHKFSPKWLIPFIDKKVITAQEILDNLDRLDNKIERGGWRIAELAEIYAMVGEPEKGLSLIASALMKIDSEKEIKTDLQKQKCRLLLGKARVHFRTGEFSTALSIIEEPFPEAAGTSLRFMQMQLRKDIQFVIDNESKTTNPDANDKED